MKEALKLALKALEEADEIEFWNKQKQAITAIKEALAQPPLPAHEPVATDAQIALLDPWMRPAAAKELLTQILALTPPAAQPAQEPDELTIAYMSGLYDGKKKRPWIGLTDVERSQLVTLHHGWNEYGQAIEAALRSKNYG
jgi:hypothetical protein